MKHLTQKQLDEWGRTECELIQRNQACDDYATLIYSQAAEIEKLKSTIQKQPSLTKGIWKYAAAVAFLLAVLTFVLFVLFGDSIAAHGQSIMPPMPASYKVLQSPRAASATAVVNAAMVIPLPPATITLAWNMPLNQPTNYVAVIMESNDLKSWNQFYCGTATNLTLPATNGCMLFRAKGGLQ